MLLQIIYVKAQYTNEYEFDPSKQDEYEADFLEYRRNLFTLFKSVTRMVKSISIEFLKSKMMNVLKNYSSLPFQEIEIALNLFYHIAEPLASEALNGEDHFFTQSFCAILTNSKYINIFIYCNRYFITSTYFSSISIFSNC